MLIVMSGPARRCVLAGPCRDAVNTHAIFRSDISDLMGYGAEAAAIITAYPQVAAWCARLRGRYDGQHTKPRHNLLG